MYFRNLIPRLVKKGDDGNCGSTAVCDTMCLQVNVLTNVFYLDRHHISLNGWPACYEQIETYFVLSDKYHVHF